MGNDLFRMSQQPGIYHTYSLWSRLSPHLTGGKPADAQHPASKDTTETKPLDRDDKEPPIEFSSSD